MSVSCQMVMEAMDKMAPRHLAESWDNVGLLVGNPAQSITKILVCLDVTEIVVKHAIATGVNLIIAHHPLIFKPLQNLRTDYPQGKLLVDILKADIAVFSAHTNLDIASNGVNDVLAARFQLQDVECLTSSYSEKLFKLAVFVPKDYVEVVRKAITAAGAGHIGKYSDCTYHSEGIGAFLPCEGSSPFIGEQGKLTYTPEVKLETIMPERISKKVVKAMLKSHPYEEVAYDVYPLLNSSEHLGLGRIGKLSSAITLAEFALVSKEVLGINQAKIVGPLDKKIHKVAVCGGSGASLIKRAAFLGADVLVTGDLKYHEAQDAISLGLAVIDAGHYATEVPIVIHIVDYLKKCAAAAKWNVEIDADEVSHDVFTVIV